MPARIYSAPEEVGPAPEFDAFSDAEHHFDGNAYLAACEAWTVQVSEWAREQHPDDALAGERWRYQIGDGYAQYVVYTSKPLALIWLPLGDDWQIPDVVRRGLRLTDVRNDVERSKRIGELFGRKS